MTGKDLDYMSDIFEWNYNALKMAKYFNQNIQNEQINDLFDAITSLHTNNCKQIIAILGGYCD